MRTCAEGWGALAQRSHAAAAAAAAAAEAAPWRVLAQAAVNSLHRDVGWDANGGLWSAEQASAGLGGCAGASQQQQGAAGSGHGAEAVRKWSAMPGALGSDGPR